MNHHRDQSDIPHFQFMQYRSIKVFEETWANPDICGLLNQTLPNALYLVRDHPLSEQKGDMERDPVGTGIRHANEWHEKVRQNRVHTPLDRSYYLGINEADSNHLQRQINEYNTAYLDRLSELGLRGGGGSFSVGHPSTKNLDPNEKPDWSWYEDMHQAIVRGGHILVVHEYGLPNDFGWGYWCNRIQYCPWRDVRIIVGECGIDSGVAEDRPSKGWLHPNYRMTPEEYANWLNTYMLAIDNRIHSVMPFTYDFAHPWDSFDLRPARQALENYSWSPSTVPPVVIPGPGPTPVDPPVASDLFERSIGFIKRWEGGYVNDPNDPGGETNWGISKRSYPNLDIKNLTWEQAKMLYQQDYWKKSGADQMPWPLCLIHMDTSVNAGVGRAQEMLQKSDGNFLRYAGHLIDWYTRLELFDRYGRAWIRRRADILLEASK